MKQERITVGAIVNAHGIRGEVKLNPVGFDPAFLAEFDRFSIGGKEMAVRSSRVHKSVLLVTLPGVLHYPAHKVYEVKGAREYLIPAVPEVFIASVDIDGGVVRVHNMKGLATDEN